MTLYRLEFYSKFAKSPYEVKVADLPHGMHPTFTNTKECFNYQISQERRVKVRYASNGALAAEKYYDRKGNGRLRWFTR